jgi:hypothetical protein
VDIVLTVKPADWQETFLRAPQGASILVLSARHVGKTTTAAGVTPGSLSLIACPAQRQRAEAVRRVRESVLKAGAELKSDNVYALELKNGSRALALPGTDDSIRGLMLDGWIIADEAVRLPDNDLILGGAPTRASEARPPPANTVQGNQAHTSYLRTGQGAFKHSTEIGLGTACETSSVTYSARIA